MQSLQKSTAENIYMVPGTDENTLYGQLEDFLVGSLTRNEVR